MIDWGRRSATTGRGGHAQSSLLRKGTAAGGSLLLVALLVGCVAAPHPAKTAVAEPSPTPSETASAPKRPTPSYSIGCSDLVSQDTLRAAMAPDVELVPYLKVTSSQSPWAMGVDQVGGLSCAWKNAVSAKSTLYGADPALRLADVQILPQGRADFERYAEDYAGMPAQESPWPDAVGPSCYAATPGLKLNVCTINVLVGESWVTMLLQGVGDNAVATDAEANAAVIPFVDEIIAALTPESGAARTDWVTGAGATPLPDTCDGFISGEQLDEIFQPEEGHLGTRLPEQGGHSVRSAVSDISALSCSISFEKSDSGVGSFAASRAGGWAFDVLQQLRSADQEVSSVGIPGVSDGAAFIACETEPVTNCRIDLSVGGNWLVIATSSTSSADETAEDVLRQQAAQLATEIVANLAG